MAEITAPGSGEAAARATEESAFYHEAALNAAWTGSRLAIGAPRPPQAGADASAAGAAGAAGSPGRRTATRSSSSRPNSRSTST